MLLEMKRSFDDLAIPGERISDHENRILVIIQKHKEKKIKLKLTKICEIISNILTSRRTVKWGRRNTWEIMTETVPKLMDVYSQFQGVQHTLSKIKTKKIRPRHIKENL